MAGAKVTGGKKNNDLVELKIDLRVQSLPDKDKIRVLDAFGGEGILWNTIKRRFPEKEILVLGIDQKKYKRVQLQGENIKFLLSMDLSQFDIIDLDAYGMPTKQLEILFDKGYPGIVHCTVIQKIPTMDHIILKANGYTKEMIKKCPSLFAGNGIQKFLNYLAKKGVRKVKLAATKDHKYYFWFKNEAQK